MKISKSILQAHFITLSTLALSQTAAADDTVKFTIEGGVSAVADSNVGIPDLDQNTDNSDVAVELRGRLQMDIKPTKEAVIRAGYEITDTSYQDFGEFDLQTHRGFAEAEYDFKVVKAGVLANYVHARLDDEGYLDYTQIQPNISRLFGDSVFVRGAYVKSFKDFKTQDGRDAEGDAARVDAFFFLNGNKQYISVGGQYGEEDAELDQFDFKGGSAQARYTQRFDVLGKETTMRFGAEYENRDYQAVDPAIGEERQDEIVSAESDVEVEIAGPVSMDFGYKYRDRQSNLDSADYDEHVGKVGLKVEF
ncbi:surface lipoprotein assembly modifier [Henriciella sp. AS95]|uniref:surface lipoprotein assembly modifier n=1 Tax=Henriciella sp. AS95 TaxID=3135782 RepID=UPI00317A964F